MNDYISLLGALIGIAYSVLAVIIGVLWSESKSNRSSIVALQTKLAGEYHDKDAVRQLVIDLISPMRDQLSRIEAMGVSQAAILETIRGSNFHNRPPVA